MTNAVVTVVEGNQQSKGTSPVSWQSRDSIPTPSMTTLQLIATAGGLLDFARSKDIRVVRIEHGRSVDFRFDYEAATRTDEGLTTIVEHRAET
jgi:hypothetical protein